MASVFAYLVTLGLAAADPVAGWAAKTPACEMAAKHCFGLDVRVAVAAGDPVVAPDWLSDQVREANRLFAVISVSFEVASVTAIDEQWARIDTRLQRDQLGRRPRREGVIDVFVVGRLADVDIAGEEIRGVHWRDRADTTQRHIILSAISAPLVMAHELGHFFGLPHGSHPRSIMNKKPRDRPPYSERGFVSAEQAKMRTDLAGMLASKRLRLRQPAP